MRTLFFTQIIHFLINIQPTTTTRPLSQFKTGLNPKNDQIFRDFIQINQHKKPFYKKMRKCNLKCYVSEKCARKTCSKCRKRCINGRRKFYGVILNSKCLENNCSDKVCLGDDTVNSKNCKKCQKKCFKSKFRKVFPSCFEECKKVCFKKSSSLENRRICRVCVP